MGVQSWFRLGTAPTVEQYENLYTILKYSPEYDPKYRLLQGGNPKLETLHPRLLQGGGSTQGLGLMQISVNSSGTLFVCFGEPGVPNLEA